MKSRSTAAVEARIFFPADAAQVKLGPDYLERLKPRGRFTDVRDDSWFRLLKDARLVGPGSVSDSLRRCRRSERCGGWRRSGSGGRCLLPTFLLRARKTRRRPHSRYKPCDGGCGG